MHHGRRGPTVTQLLLFIAAVAVVLGSLRAHISLGALVFSSICLGELRASRIRKRWQEQGFLASRQQGFGLLFQSILAASGLLFGTFLMGLCGFLTASSFIWGPLATQPSRIVMTVVSGVMGFWFLKATLWEGSMPNPPWPPPGYDAAPEMLRPLAKLVGYDPSRYHGNVILPTTDATRRPDP